jgi:hypothetical protein
MDNAEASLSYAFAIGAHGGGRKKEDMREQKQNGIFFTASSKTASLPRWHGDVSCHISKNDRM